MRKNASSKRKDSFCYILLNCPLVLASQINLQSGAVVPNKSFRFCETPVRTVEVSLWILLMILRL